MTLPSKLKEREYKYIEQLIIHRLIRFIESNYVMAWGILCLMVWIVILGTLGLLKWMNLL